MKTPSFINPEQHGAAKHTYSSYTLSTFKMFSRLQQPRIKLVPIMCVDRVTVSIDKSFEVVQLV